MPRAVGVGWGNGVSAVPGRARARFARRLRALRAERGWSQAMLAKVAGVDRSYISAIERGQRNVGLDTIGRLAEALGVRVSELFG